MGLTQNYYTQALHWFHSKAITAQQLSTMWHEWLITHPKVHRQRGQAVDVGDGIKVGKEGKKMPAVKKLHNESENVTKSEWIRGHYFGVITLYQIRLIAHTMNYQATSGSRLIYESAHSD
ncbi:MAG: hypothetical protein F6K18_08550 [Okeania sp. SIO2C2]|uniref:hypothetical protein n=1 Tax=Okeania sp. SIO2C2 TaxID=2607787 RepID=UPI0013B931AA|nr:hypothetical protein [Okeania sp. SIO2C2]NEP86879.1 hypothetical protein [Okeania sp. SIO2C2]